ncbi:M20/M25/M40 family metallo-hydrolase [Planctomycetota bacterium]
MTQEQLTTDEQALQGADRAVEILQALLRIDTRNPPGNERVAVDYVRGLLTAAGVQSEVFEPAPGRANLVARLKGDESGGGPLLLSSHLDVVAVERDKWTRDPFGGEIADGCIWGRGAVDMKGLTAFEIETFLGLKRSGARLKRDVILLCLADEEAGMQHGSRFMVENEPDKIRAEYALNEVGGFTVHLGGKRLYPIGTAEKGYCWIEVKAEGEPGHASVPRPQNAVVHLTRAIARTASGSLSYRVHEAARGFIDAAATALGGAQGLLLRGLLHPVSVGSVLRILQLAEPAKASVFRAMLHQTITPTVLAAGEKENVIPSEARAVLDGRFLPGTASADLLREVEGFLGPHVRARIISEGQPSEVPIDGPFYQLLARKLKEHDPAGIPCPWLTVGFTDASNLSRLGTRCYGFYPLKLPPDLNFASIVHGHDERVPLSGYRWGFTVFEDLVRSFVT